MTAVALFVPVLSFWIGRRQQIRDMATQSLAASAQALAVLQLIDQLQTELYELQRTPYVDAVTIGRDWSFEVRAAEKIMKDVTARQYTDIVLTEQLAKVHLWAIDAGSYLPPRGGTDEDRRVNADDRLRKLQASTDRRKAVEVALKNNMPIFLDIATNWWPKSRKPKAE